MRATRSGTAAWRVLVLALTFASACGGGGPATGEGDGIVRAVDREAGRVTLDHGTIPGMMDAMRMDFEVADPTLLEGLEPGDEVRIEVVQQGETYTITKLELAEPDGAE